MLEENDQAGLKRYRELMKAWIKWAISRPTPAARLAAYNMLKKHVKKYPFLQRSYLKDAWVKKQDGKVLEVSIHIFDEDCYAFQPFYKMDKATASAWIGKVCQFITEGQNKCYAENALNEIFPALNIRAFSYEDYYIDEIDNLDDHARVTADILAYDEADKALFA